MTPPRPYPTPCPRCGALVTVTEVIHTDQDVYSKLRVCSCSQGCGFSRSFSITVKQPC